MTGTRRAGWALLEAARSPWPYTVAIAFAVGIGMLHHVAGTLSRARVLERRESAARAHLVADVAALATAGERGGRTTIAGITATVVHDGGRVIVTTRDGSGAGHRFVAPWLPGSAPAAFAHALAAVEPPEHAGAVALASSDVPALDAAALARAVCGEACRIVRRDQGTALRHLEAGTDADDFVFAGDAVDLGAAGELLHVRGHLWVPPAAAPLDLTARSDVVVVVSGNLYLGRDVRVTGEGRVLFAVLAPRGACSFADADHNGRWSVGDRLRDAAAFTGPIEGAGGVFCGLGAPAAIRCDAGVFVAGELHVATEATFAGPLVLAHGVTTTAPAGRLHALGAWGFAPERERVPGFATAGAPRPGVLRGEPALAAGAARQTLYLAGLDR